MPDTRVTRRFFVALAVLIASLAAVVVLGIVGLEKVGQANDQIYADNFQTALANSRLGRDIGRAESLGLVVAARSDGVRADRLRAQLRQIVIPQVNADIADLLRLHATDPPAERRAFARIPREWRSFLALARRGVLASGTALGASGGAVAARTVAAALDPLGAFVVGRQSVELKAASAAHKSAEDTYRRSLNWLLVASAAALLAALALIQVGLTLKRLVDQRLRERRQSESAGEYIDTLQVTEDEDEAQELLRRQVERSIDGSRAVVLARNNSADRLEPKTSLDQLPELRDPLSGAVPRSCLAVRFGRNHAEERAGTALTSCEICGALPGASTCEPLLVGGEVIGSVLINVDGEAPPDRRRSRETVAQAAPVLANLRNLAIAELRAATDPLTGLPNQRAIQDTLKRMVAQASRTISPLAALLVDLDHFKQINDVCGHDRGDEVLAAVGVALRSVLRDSDFAGRYGGEEFLMLLPDTDSVGAVRVAEAVRAAVGAISLPGIDRPITASVGVAVLPDHAGEATTLFRMADRALYAAKNAGRDRVESATRYRDEAGASHVRVPQPMVVDPDGGSVPDRSSGGPASREPHARA
ncbi:MAG TPA: GGDEF domain-containing protein [Solirubrobacterales bacterium]|nr:GGDEF domain-containing protein [Solirubrobacterales bacterium]